MNSNIDKITKGLAEVCRECIRVAYNDPSTKNEITRGGGSSGGIMTRLLAPRPISRIRISEDALKVCLEKNVPPFDCFVLTDAQRRKKYDKFFSSNEKTVENCHKEGHFVTADHNMPNKAVLEKMIELCENNPDADVYEYRDILNEQSLDIITIEENLRLKAASLESSGSKSYRDTFCSKKYEFVDLILTPQDVIDEFFKVSGIDKNECWDPCAADGRWLDGSGFSSDILPMKKGVVEKDFLTVKDGDLPDGINKIVGHVPASLLDEFVKKALTLVDDCYFLVEGASIFKNYSKNIEHLYIFSGLEGDQKDNRSRCEFSVPFLIKTTLWCCIVHITKEEQKEWIIEKDLANDEIRDGYHVALGRNVFVKSEKKIDELNDRITKISVKAAKKR